MSKFIIIYEILENIARYLTPFPILLYLILGSKNDLGKRIVFYFMVYNLTKVVISGINNVYYPLSINYYNQALYTPIELSFFSFFFYHKIEHSTFKKINIGVVIAFWIYILWFSEESWGSVFDSIPTTIESIIIIAYCLLYFHQEIKKPATEYMYSKTDFWIVSALFLYMSGNFFIYMYAAQLLLQQDFANMYMIIHGIFYSIRNIIFSMIMFLPLNNGIDNIASSKAVR